MKNGKRFHTPLPMGVARILVRGEHFWGKPRGGPGAEPRRRRRIFESFKDFFKKIAKTHYFSIFQKINRTMRQFFARLDKKHKL